MSEPYVIPDRRGTVKVESWTAVLEELISKGGDIGKELLRAAMVNPLIGIFVMLVISDILEKKEIIFKETAIMFKALIVSAAGIELGAELLAMITSILPFSPARNPAPEIFKPSAQTLVFVDGGGNMDKLLPLLAKMGVK